MIHQKLMEAARNAARVEPRFKTTGKVVRMAGMTIEAHAPGAHVGTIVELARGNGFITGEVIGFREHLSLIVPFGDVRGLSAGARVTVTDRVADIPVSKALLGRVIDPFGLPLDGGPAILASERTAIDRPAPPIEDRVRITKRFETGVRAIDVLLTAGLGQRVGLFAGAGVGKTVLIRQIAAQSKADVTVIGLIGERGGEVRDVLETHLGDNVCCVVATSDRSALERCRGALAATAIAEYFRDQGKSVLLVIDSLTRYAMALREIGLAAGEPPASKGYPPSVFATLPKLLERSAPLASGGSITGFYTVLMEGDDLSDPVADSARSLLDGHIVLSRDLAARGHFPAIDLLHSASRVARQVETREVTQLADRARGILAAKREADELKSLGAYTPGTSPLYDEALELGAKIMSWAHQRSDERSSHEEAAQKLAQALVRAPAKGAVR